MNRQARYLGCIVVLGTALFSAPHLGAQGPAALRIGADNDAFNFWIPPWDRTDREYSSGVRGSLVYGKRTYTLGQAIYTGDTQVPSSSHRPNAGWLFVEVSERDSSANVVREYGAAFGVVGPPALGEPMQKLFHGLGPEYQRPVDWRRQIPFEVGFLARYSRTTDVLRYESGAITTHFGGSIGTILTRVTGGLGATRSIRLGGESASKWWPTLELRAEAFAHGVARDEFLDGAMFRSSEHVDKKRFYDEERLGFGMRWSRVTLSYRANRTGLQYNGQPGPAEWSSIDLEWRR